MFTALGWSWWRKSISDHAEKTATPYTQMHAVRNNARFCPSPIHHANAQFSSLPLHTCSRDGSCPAQRLSLSRSSHKPHAVTHHQIRHNHITCSAPMPPQNWVACQCLVDGASTEDRLDAHWTLPPSPPNTSSVSGGHHGHRRPDLQACAP